MKSTLLTCAIATTMAITAHAQAPAPLAGNMVRSVLDDRSEEPRPVTLPADDSAHSGYFVYCYPRRMLSMNSRGVSTMTSPRADVGKCRVLPVTSLTPAA
jgi:hypothetical protein